MDTHARFKSPIEIKSNNPYIVLNEDVLGDSRVKDLINLGMPNENRISIKWAGECFKEDYRGYSIEVFGVDAEDFETTNREILFRVGAATPHHIVYWKKTENFSIGGAMYVWVCRVYAPDSKTIWEELWIPSMGCVPMVNNVWIRHAEIAIGLIQSIEAEPDSSNKEASQQAKTGGRKKLSEDHWFGIAQLAAFKVGERGDLLSHQSLANEMRYSKKTIERYKKDFPMVWQKIEDAHRDGLKTYSSKRGQETK